MTTTTRQRRSICAVVACLLLAACSGQSAARRPSPGPTSTPSAAISGPDAAAALHRAGAKTAALRSYAFLATQTLSGGPRTQATQVQGWVIRRPAATSYVVTVGGKVQEIVQVNARTYRRIRPGPWQLLVKRLPQQDPVAALLLLLANLHQPSLAGSQLTGTVPAATLARAQLAPAGAALGAPAPLTLSLSPDGHVIALTLRVLVRSGSTTLQLLERTTFSGFDRAAAVIAPIRHR